MITIPEIAWPENFEEIEIVGMSIPVAFMVSEAVENDRVRLVSTDRNVWYRTYVFDYLGFRYQLETESDSAATSGGDRLRGEETIETPYRLSKIARLEVDELGEEFPVPFTPELETKPKPERSAEWGTF